MTNSKSQNNKSMGRMLYFAQHIKVEWFACVFISQIICTKRCFPLSDQTSVFGSRHTVENRCRKQHAFSMTQQWAFSCCVWHTHTCHDSHDHVTKHTYLTRTDPLPSQTQQKHRPRGHIWTLMIFGFSPCQNVWTFTHKASNQNVQV